MPQFWPGWADVWQSALRASKPRSLPRKTFPGRACRTADPSASLRRKTFPGKVRGTADPSASLGMTKGRVVLPSEFDDAEDQPQVPPAAALDGSAALPFVIPSGRWACGLAASPPKEMKNTWIHQPLFMEASPFPLSSRAKPRDLQFRGPLLEMFFDRA